MKDPVDTRAVAAAVIRQRQAVGVLTTMPLEHRAGADELAARAQAMRRHVARARAAQPGTGAFSVLAMDETNG